MTLLRSIIGVCLLLSLQSCSTVTPQQPVPKSTLKIMDRAYEQGFELRKYKTDYFVLTAMEHGVKTHGHPLSLEETHGETHGHPLSLKKTHGHPLSLEEKKNRGVHVLNKGGVHVSDHASDRGGVHVLEKRGVQLIHVYIEGDGNSWRTKYILSDNPTPRQPIALQLALTDPFPNVIYFGRPCQYTPHAIDGHCDAKFWSSHRYAPEVIKSYNQALDQIKVNYPNIQFLLVGFSGGASVAALIASQRNDVQGLITVAGDLNHEALNNHHGTTPLSGSLNPYKVTEKLRNLPQHHWSGGNDRIVPTFIAKDFVKKVNNPKHVKSFELKKATHHKEWEKNWQNILNKFNDNLEK